MLTTFDKHEQLLRLLGNYRLPYMIYATADAIAMHHPAYMQLYSMQINEQHYVMTDYEDNEAMLKDIAASNCLVCVVHGDMHNFMPFMYNELIATEHEVSIASEEVKRTYRLSASNQSYIRQTLQITAIRAMHSDKLVLAGHKAELYETLYRIIGTDVCFLAIWDTRLITAVAELPGYNFMMHKDANDNSKKFYIQADMLSSLPQHIQANLQSFIADTLQ